jgi:hypothetical protein
VNKKKNNIIILALFHLLVFTFPFAIKDIHHHETHYIHIINQATDGKLLSKAEKACPICQFEFVSFIAGDSQAYWTRQPVCLIKNCNFVQQAYKVPLISYLLRAPPIA